jgi:hypothetical protein
MKIRFQYLEKKIREFFLSQAAPWTNADFNI